MFCIITVYLWLSFKYSQTQFLIQEDWLLSQTSTSGFGNIVKQIETSSMLACGQECVMQFNCTAANYYPRNKTCTLLYVEDVLDDWEETDDGVTYICVDCDPGPKGRVALSSYTQNKYICEILQCTYSSN